MIISHREIKPYDITAMKCRPGDELGFEAAGVSTAEAIQLSVKNSIDSYAVCEDNEVIAMWGYGARGMVADCAYGWLLTTPKVEEHRFRFARSSIRIVNHILEIYPALEVTVHLDFFESRKWLKWLGFKYCLTPPPKGFVYMRKER